MKTKELAEKYQFDLADFEAYLKKVNAPVEYGIFLSSMTLPDDKAEYYVDAYQKEHAQVEEERIRNRAEAEEKQKKRDKALEEMLVTSGFNFEGYDIVKYAGYVSGDSYVEISRTAKHTLGSDVYRYLEDMRLTALERAKLKAYNLGCNAVIGIDFDYISMEPERSCHDGYVNYEPYVVGATANGTAVVVEKRNREI